MNALYLDDPESREWILSGHASILSEQQRDLIRRCTSAFILYGNEDCPDRIEFYSTNAPMNGEFPMFVLQIDNDGVLRATT